MRKTVILTLTLVLFASIACNLAFAQGDGEPLSPQQVKKLSKLYERLYRDHVKLLELYAEYGQITPEQKEKKLEMLRRHHEWLKEHHYDLDAYKEYGRHHHHHHKHHQDPTDVEEQEQTQVPPAQTN